MTTRELRRIAALRLGAAAVGIACALLACEPGAKPAGDEVPLTAEQEDRLMDRYLEGLERVTEIVREVQARDAEPAAAAEIEDQILELRRTLDQIEPISEAFRVRNLERYFQTARRFYDERRRVEQDPDLGELLEPLFSEIPTPE